jgi:DNA replicative helicase MCM subunit Mcm2 (Cdc46/Mcm family)
VFTSGGKFPVLTSSYINTALCQSAFRIYKCYIINALICVVEAKPESCRDYQEIKVQELIQNLAIGTIPRRMWVVLEDDLVDSCKPGDDVTICGIVMRRWKSVKIDVSITLLREQVEDAKWKRAEEGEK